MTPQTDNNLTWEGLEDIRKAVERLEDLGDIKCAIPECGDIICASVVLHNAITEAQIELAEFLSKRDKQLAERIIEDIQNIAEQTKIPGHPEIVNIPLIQFELRKKFL